MLQVGGGGGLVPVKLVKRLISWILEVHRRGSCWVSKTICFCFYNAGSGTSFCQVRVAASGRASC